MTLAANLTAYDIGAFRGEVAGFDLKTKNAYVEMTLQMRLHGSLFNDDAYLARLGQCGVKLWKTRVWPQLASLFELGDDGRIYHPDIERAPRTKPKLARPELSEVRRDAANSRWRDANGHANGHANGMQTGMQTDAKYADNSTVVASRFASARAPDATLSLSDSQASDSKDDPANSSNPQSLRERVAPASASAADADANEHAKPAGDERSPDANGDANGDANRHAKPVEDRPSHFAIPLDWKPSPAGVEAAKRGGLDVEKQTEKFINDRRAKGIARADWDAEWLNWVVLGVEWLKGKGHQSHIPLVLPGGKVAESAPESVPEPEPEIVGDGPAAQWARVGRGLKVALTPGVFKNWFAKAVLVGIDDDGEATVSLQNEFFRDHVRKNFADQATALWRAENPDIKRVEFVVATPEQKSASG